MATRTSSRTRNRRAAPQGTGNDSPMCNALLKTVDLGIGAVIFIAPHLLGGRHAVGRFAIVFLCVATAIAWFTRHCLTSNAKWTRFSAWIVPALALSVVVLQLVPFPVTWLSTLVPRLHELLPLWSEANTSAPLLGHWQTLSLAPEETRLALATLVAYVLLFVTIVQRIENTDDIARLMRMLGLSAVGVASFGIIQFFTTNGKFFWFYEYPFTNTSRELKAGFTCRNHFAHFLVLGFAMLLSWVMLERHSTSTKPRPSRSNHGWQPKHDNLRFGSWVLVALLLLVTSTILAALSRGGILAMATVVVVAAGIYFRAGLFGSNQLIIGGLLMVLAMAALSLSGKYTDVSNRLDDLVSRDVTQIDSVASRQTIWAANLASIRDSWLTGSARDAWIYLPGLSHRSC